MCIRDSVLSANIYCRFNVRTCWAANYNLRHSSVAQRVDLLVAGICVARYAECVDHVVTDYLPDFSPLTSANSGTDSFSRCERDTVSLATAKAIGDAIGAGK